MKRRYVILRHEGIEHPHFDLMIESVPGCVLWTWRCEGRPFEAGAVIRRIQNHRPAYLAKEGEIGAGKGHVKRVDEGEVDVERKGKEWHILRGSERYVMRPHTGKFWTIKHA